MHLKFEVLGFLFAGIFLNHSCLAQDHPPTGIDSALSRYERLLVGMNPDSIASEFTPDGNLGDQAQGRAAISLFLSQFKNVRLLEETMRSDSLVLSGDRAFQEGRYRQSDLISGQPDTVRVRGHFRIEWQWSPDDGWLIRRIRTSP